MAPFSPQPFTVEISGDAIADLRERLGRTRWPESETVDDWSQGVPLSYVRELCAWWAHEYDMGLAERVNTFPQFKVEIDGLKVHYIHVRSPEPAALPMVLTHGWPGSVVEFLDVIGPLTDPRAHGGDPADAFDVVVPSLPGYGWSDKPNQTGWGVERIATAWAELMSGLGYDRYVAQGGDWGAGITAQMAADAPAGLAAIHLNMAFAYPDSLDDLTPTEIDVLADLDTHSKTGMGYSSIQSTRPQTLGYGLTDSPAGQLAWIVEKFWAWTDCDGHPEGALSRTQMLDNVSTYWFTETAASSARLYWESFDKLMSGFHVELPTGITIFPREILRPSKRWAEKAYANLVFYEEVDRGGHFAAFEQPDVFVEQVRNCFRPIRTQ